MTRPLAWDEPCPNTTCVRTGPHRICRSTLTVALIDDTYAAGGVIRSAGSGTLPGSRWTYPHSLPSTAGSALVTHGARTSTATPGLRGPAQG